jgi:phosphate-selective porin OprO/OprP
MRLAALLLAGSALAAAAPASAQQQSDDVAAELAALRERVQQLEARLAAQEAQPRTADPTPAAAPSPAAAAAPARSAAPAPAPAATQRAADNGTVFRGAPEFRSGGFSFKPRGRLQYDFGTVSSPRGIADRGLGFGNELRRARLGVEGSLPGGLGYVFELDFADNEVEITDAILNWRPSSAATITIGQHNPFQSLEELTSSRFTSFLERAAFTDAFGFERRVGLSAAYSDGPLLLQGGVFTDNIEDLSNDENDSAGVEGRIVFAPKAGDTQLHFGASGHYRSNNDLFETGATTRFRQRPAVHFTDTRFIGTPALRVENETSWGLEAAMIRGPFHAAAEVHWLDADTPTASPTFFGGYVEAGLYLTGERRGYRNGRFDRTSVRRPVGGGDNAGIGAIQLNLRYDRLDLNSGGILGGTQDGYLASIIWIPQDYVRFMINAGHLRYDDAAIPAAGGDRSYGVNVIAARAQVDF